MWLIFALCAALFSSTTSMLLKIVIQKAKIGFYTLTWVIAFFGSLFLLPFLYIYGLPKINPQFWLLLVLLSCFHIAGSVSYFITLKNADLSLAAPITSLTPLFLLFTSPFLSLISGEDASREIPNILGIIGIILLTIGAYIINLNTKRGFLYPIKFIFTNNGSRMALITAFIWSVKAGLDKQVILNILTDNYLQKSIFFCISIFWSISFLIFPFMIREILMKYILVKTNKKQPKPLGVYLDKYRKSKLKLKHKSVKSKLATYKGYIMFFTWKNWISFVVSFSYNIELISSKKRLMNHYRKTYNFVKKRQKILMLIGIVMLNTAAVISYMMAVSLTLVVYAIAVKRLEVLINVLWGVLLLGESNFTKKMAGSVTIVLGITCIHLADSI